MGDDDNDSYDDDDVANETNDHNDRIIINMTILHSTITTKRSYMGYNMGLYLNSVQFALSEQHPCVLIADGIISGPVVFEQYIVLESYKKQNKNDIDLYEGQVVEVVEKRDNGAGQS